MARAQRSMMPTLGRRLALVGVLAVALDGCALFAQEPPPEQVLIAVCREFVALKPLVTKSINIDALRPAERRKYEYKDLAAIRLANAKLNGLCPPPEGFAPLALTLEAARSSLAVLAGYSAVQTANHRDGRREWP